jgi:hypothetical protein
VTLVRRGDIAALVSDIPLDRPLGTPEDLVAHQRVLDAAATEIPVLPLRFGAVLADRDAAADELLATHHDEFHAALRELEGRIEYIVRGRYVQDTLLREAVSESPQAVRLRDEIRTRPEDTTREQRIALGELVSRAIAGKRTADTRRVVDLLAPLSVAVNVLEPTHEQDAAHVAILVETARQAQVRDALRELGDDWAGRVQLRLLGPLAPYDFVTTTQGEGIR